MTPADDDGPSQEDLRRFGGEHAYCPDCGAQVWDQADVCPKCYAYLGGDTARRRSTSKREWRKLVLVILLVALLISFAGASFYLRMFFGGR